MDPEQLRAFAIQQLEQGRTLPEVNRMLSEMSGGDVRSVAQLQATLSGVPAEAPQAVPETGGISAGDAARMAAQGFTFGLASDITGLGAGAAEAGRQVAGGGMDFGAVREARRSGREASRQRVEDIREAHPVAGTTAEIVGSVAFPVGGAMGLLGRGGLAFAPRLLAQGSGVPRTAATLGAETRALREGFTQRRLVGPGRESFREGMARAAAGDPSAPGAYLSAASMVRGGAQGAGAGAAGGALYGFGTAEEGERLEGLLGGAATGAAFGGGTGVGLSGLFGLGQSFGRRASRREARSARIAEEGRTQLLGRAGASTPSPVTPASPPVEAVRRVLEDPALRSRPGEAVTRVLGNDPSTPAGRVGIALAREGRDAIQGRATIGEVVTRQGRRKDEIRRAMYQTMEEFGPIRDAGLNRVLASDDLRPFLDRVAGQSGRRPEALLEGGVNYRQVQAVRDMLRNQIDRLGDGPGTAIMRSRLADAQNELNTSLDRITRGMDPTANYLYRDQELVSEALNRSANLLGRGRDELEIAAREFRGLPEADAALRIGLLNRIFDSMAEGATTPRLTDRLEQQLEFATRGNQELINEFVGIMRLERRAEIVEQGTDLLIKAAGFLWGGTSLFGNIAATAGGG
jgi:hypothetical protein